MESSSLLDPALQFRSVTLNREKDILIPELLSPLGVLTELAPQEFDRVQRRLHQSFSTHLFRKVSCFCFKRFLSLFFSSFLFCYPGIALRLVLFHVVDCETACHVSDFETIKLVKSWCVFFPLAGKRRIDWVWSHFLDCLLSCLFTLLCRTLLLSIWVIQEREGGRQREMEYATVVVMY